MDSCCGGLRLSPEEGAHFGFVREGGVYTQRIHIMNENPSQAIRFNIISPHSSNGTGRRNNKVRLFMHNTGNLPTGLKAVIDVVFFAVKSGLFADEFKIITPTSSMMIEIRGIVLAESELTFVHKRLHLENRPLLKPGVICLGNIRKGQRKYLCSPFPIQKKETILKGQRPRSRISIASSFPEEMELKALGSKVDADLDLNLLKQLRPEEAEELRIMPYVTATFWDTHQCKQFLSKRLIKWPTDKTKDVRLHCEQVFKDEAAQLLLLERKGFLSSRLLAALRRDKRIGRDCLEDKPSSVSDEELTLGSNRQDCRSGNSSSTGESVSPVDKSKLGNWSSMSKVKKETDESPLYRTVGTPKILINLSKSLERASNTDKICC